MFFSGAREDIVNPGREELPTGIYAGYTLTERVCQDDVFRYPHLSPVSLDAKGHGLYCRFLLHTTDEAPLCDCRQRHPTYSRRWRPKRGGSRLRREGRLCACRQAASESRVDSKGRYRRRYRRGSITIADPRTSGNLNINRPWSNRPAHQN